MASMHRLTQERVDIYLGNRTEQNQTPKKTAHSAPAIRTLS